MSIFKTFFKMMGGFFAVILFLLIVAILLATLSDFKPPPRQILKPSGNITTDVIIKNHLSILSWNIGYGGLGREMDFFYDGGLKVRPPRQYYHQSIEGIKNFIRQNDSVDFVFLQEVDVKSKRSYRDNQVHQFGELLPDFESVFAVNYDVTYIPFPVNRPMGQVLAGMMSFSRYKQRSSERVSFEQNFTWPKKLFMLDRCFIIQRFFLQSGKVLVLINTHNSTYDNGTLSKVERNMLIETAIAEFKKGNYVIVGGDWNLNPPGYKLSAVLTGDIGADNGVLADDNLKIPECWQWAFDNKIPSNRYADEPYQKGRTKTTVIDYFLLSPNLKLTDIKTIDLGFEFSDHNPVRLNIEIH